LDQVLYNTSKEHFAPILNNILELLIGDNQDLAIDLLLSCCAFKNGVKISDWSIVTNSCTEILNTNGVDSRRKYQLAALLVAKSDPVVSKLTAQKIFEIFTRKGDKYVGVFCQLIGKLNSFYFQQWVLEEYVK
jgi:hypothetical protein